MCARILIILLLIGLFRTPRYQVKIGGTVGQIDRKSRRGLRFCQLRQFPLYNFVFKALVAHEHCPSTKVEVGADFRNDATQSIQLSVDLNAQSLKGPLRRMAPMTAGRRRNCCVDQFH